MCSAVAGCTALFACSVVLMKIIALGAFTFAAVKMISVKFRVFNFRSDLFINFNHLPFCYVIEISDTISPSEPPGHNRLVFRFPHFPGNKKPTLGLPSISCRSQHWIISCGVILPHPRFIDMQVFLFPSQCRFLNLLHFSQNPLIALTLFNLLPLHQLQRTGFVSTLIRHTLPQYITMCKSI